MADVGSSLTDIKIASFVAGITVGVGFLAGWEAFKQTKSIRKPWQSIFVWMIWGEMFVCSALVVQAWLLLTNTVTLE